MKDKYYNGVKLLSLKDENGLLPEIYLCCGNRTAGKTYFFKRWILRRFIKYGEKFCLLVRFSYEMDGIADNFFKDLAQIDFQGGEFTSKTVGKNLFQELFYNGEHCGYCVALNTADTVKKYSSRFVDVTRIFFDEFQSETGKYCPDEITKFQSIHTSVARGGGQQYRRVPVYMAANTVTILNPYFVALGIHKRLNSRTKFLRGQGWVLELTLNENARDAQAQGAFNRAFADSDYMKYSQDNKFLLDTDHFIERIKGGKARYYCTIFCNGNQYGVWEHDSGVLYICHKINPSYPVNIALNPQEHNAHTVLIKSYAMMLKYFKAYFDAGMIRFEDLEIKNMMLDLLGYLVKSGGKKA